MKTTTITTTIIIITITITITIRVISSILTLSLQGQVATGLEAPHQDDPHPHALVNSISNEGPATPIPREGEGGEGDRNGGKVGRSEGDRKGGKVGSEREGREKRGRQREIGRKMRGRQGGRQGEEGREMRGR